MGHAWLDSLSEDWVSQPGSEDASFAEPAETAAPSPTPKPKLRTPGLISRIPRLSPRAKKSQNAVEISPSPSPSPNGNANGGSSSSVLGERSINERLALAASRRTPSKLSQVLSLDNSGRDCHACRSASASTTNSVVRRSFLRKSTASSPAKGKAETPEWKRRLVYGDLSYGEQRDLFTSAGTGLENMFKPPAPTPGPATDGAADDSYQGQESQLEVTLPSSPPLYPRDPSTAEIRIDESMQEPSQQLPKRDSTSTRYRRTEESANASRESGSDNRCRSCSQAGSVADQGPKSDSLGGESRKFSGRSDIRYEDFSPILLERRQASNGKTIFGPADLPPDELRKRLETLRQDQMILTGDVNEGEDGRPENHAKSPNVEPTEDYFSEKTRGFVNFQRGGRSGEGSFRNRMLSSALNESSELNPEESLQASTPKQFPTVRVELWATADPTPADSPDLPRAPDPSPEKKLAPLNGSTSSPLKLFQPYDTFTNQTLLRRLSHYEEAGDESFSIAQVDTPSKLFSPTAQNWSQRQASFANRFGAGELDGYEFHDEFSHISNDASGMDGDKENRGPNGGPRLPSQPPIFDLSLDSSPPQAADLLVYRRRQRSMASQASRRSGRLSFPAYSDILSTAPRLRDTSISEIKRPRTSPSKDHPTPKRRRTLHKSDVSYGIEDDISPTESVQLSHKQMQSAFDQLRQERRSSYDREMAEDRPVSARQSVRPRTPTSSQRSSLQRDRQPLAEIERSPARSSRYGQPPAALPVGSTVETGRKPSIKTEDFINEANKIMAMIRSKAGLASGLASLEESDEERGQQSPELEDSYQESTQEPFSRPPSREGRPPLTRMSTKQEDPALVERLKKYEEASDMGDMITSSMRSTALHQEAIHAAREQESMSKNTWNSHGSAGWLSDNGVVSDLPNARVSRNPDWHERQAANRSGDGMPSQASSGPPTQTTGMSYATNSSRGSSRGSEARKTIAPESVLHLIPDQVGNMVLDRQRNIWVKRKPSTAPKEVKQSFFHSELSEDDPFAGIPDLSVDITTEMRNLKLTRKTELPAPGDLPTATSPISPSKLSNVSLPPVDSPARTYPDPSKAASIHPQEESVEHEISIHEDRVKEPRRLTISFSSPIASVFQNVAAQNDMFLDDSSISVQGADPVAGDTLPRGRRNISIHQGTTRSMSAGSRSNSRGPMRHLSVRGQSLMARPVSRIDERDEESGQEQAQYQEAPSGMELSVLGDYSVVGREGDRGRQASLSFLLATPARGRECLAAGADAAPIISQYVGNFSLSPLPEFTMHHPEETLPFEASYLVGNHRLVTGDSSKRVLSMSMRDLVGKLAEVEPFEPDWEDMRELDLRGKGLNALQALDQFCGQLESLDVSNNQIRNLAGIPSSVRHLRMMDNQLSSLTAWSHLMNLQYVDVSNNGLTSLTGFANLFHLRSLRADNNQITSLDGIKFHKGLQTLRVRGNLIETVDFDGSTMEQLTELDLKNNKIRSIAHIAELTALNSLNLDGNQLTTFSAEPSHNQPPSPLRYLRLDDNTLTTLNVAGLPHLRLLHADRNHLSRIAGLSRARRIDSLSLREQRGDKPLHLPYLLARAYEVRKLYLSGNFLDRFIPTTDLLNLQLLELANCGLTELEEGLGLCLPNLRVLNLNLNALSDLSPLRGVPRLKRVSVAGNRLADPGRVVDVLSGFEWLGAVDLRDNPLTQGFYAPVRVMVCQGGDDKITDPFVLPDQDGERDRAYCGRLDMDTRVRRRVYEGLLGSRCGRVKRLDGLVFGKDGEGAGGGDEVLEAMREKGLVRVRSGSNKSEGGGGEKKAGNSSGRWPAEDSFA